jgi:hypothetical protein
MHLRKLLAPAILAGLTSAALAQWTTIYTDNFTGATEQSSGSSSSAIGVYSGANSYQSKATYQGGAGATGLTTNGSNLTLNAGNYAVYSYFTASNAVVDISSATTTAIKVDLDYTIPTISTSLFRIGLFNSMADSSGLYTRATFATDGAVSGGDSTAITTANMATKMTAATPFAAWTGYYLGINPSNSSAGTSLRLDQRGFSGNGIIVSTSGGNLRFHSVNTQTFAGSNTAIPTSNTDVYHLTYTIAYNAGTTPTLTFTTLITDSTTAATIINSSYTTNQIDNSNWQAAITSTATAAARFMGGYKFDTLVFGPGSNTGETVDNIIIQVATVPEPATYAACLGALSLLVVGYRRFRR